MSLSVGQSSPRDAEAIVRDGDGSGLRRVLTLHERVAVDMLRRNRETYLL